MSSSTQTSLPSTLADTAACPLYVPITYSRCDMILTLCRPTHTTASTLRACLLLPTLLTRLATLPLSLALTSTPSARTLALLSRFSQTLAALLSSDRWFNMYCRSVHTHAKIFCLNTFRDYTRRKQVGTHLTAILEHHTFSLCIRVQRYFDGMIKTSL